MTWLLLAGLVGAGFIAWFILVVLFTPRIDYRTQIALPLEDPAFVGVIRATCLAPFLSGNRVAILTNAYRFYPAMRDAIRAARSSIHLEAYIFQQGDAATMLVDAMVERAQAGVEVRLVLDAIGSSLVGRETVQRLTDAGGKVRFYQPLTWYRLHRLNNRTHRELLIVDGRVAFAGGAGVADWWVTPVDGTPSWRDTMAQIEGPIVTALQGVFAENWLECEGEMLTAPHLWPSQQPAGDTDAMLVKSSPADRATTSRVVFQMLVEGSEQTLDISTPYFLPDHALRGALIRAARRGVSVRVVVPGPLTDQRLVRLASRRLFGELLEAGVRIYEYGPAMTHVKALMADGIWSMLGTTNVDNRSFEHNDEVNLAFRDAGVTRRLQTDFEADIRASDEMTLPEWRTRPWPEKLISPIAWILERQQ